MLYVRPSFGVHLLQPLLTRCETFPWTLQYVFAALLLFLRIYFLMHHPLFSLPRKGMRRFICENDFFFVLLHPQFFVLNIIPHG